MDWIFFEIRGAKKRRDLVFLSEKWKNKIKVSPDFAEGTLNSLFGLGARGRA